MRVTSTAWWLILLAHAEIGTLRSPTFSEAVQVGAAAKMRPFKRISDSRRRPSAAESLLMEGGHLRKSSDEVLEVSGGYDMDSAAPTPTPVEFTADFPFGIFGLPVQPTEEQQQEFAVKWSYENTPPFQAPRNLATTTSAGTTAMETTSITAGSYENTRPFQAPRSLASLNGTLGGGTSSSKGSCGKILQPCTKACEQANGRIWVPTPTPSPGACPTASACAPGQEGCPENKNCAGYWKGCTAKCENATAREFKQLVAPSGTGKKCPDPKACVNGKGKCKMSDCVFTWSACTASCDRTITVTQERVLAGAACPTEHPVCSPGEDSCPLDIDCRGTWSDCTEKCEGGNERTFTKITDKSGNGNACPTSGEACAPGDGECPINVDCKGHWADCSSECEGTGGREWMSEVEPMGTGHHCPASSPLCKPGQDECPHDVDCAGVWSQCTEACEPGPDRSWEETTAKSGKGKSCPTSGPDCKPGEGECSVNEDCVGHWKDCSAACENADVRTYITVTPHSGRGAPCPVLGTAPACKPGDGGCPEDIDCEGVWSRCTEECESADRRTWQETTPKSGAGAECPPAPDCKPGEDQCPTNLDCVGEWSMCTKACEGGGGRTFQVLTNRSGAGAECPTEAPDCGPGVGACPERVSCGPDDKSCSTPLAQGVAGQLVRLLYSENGNGSKVNLGAVPNVVDAIQKSNGQVFLAWSTDALPKDPFDWKTFEKVVTFVIPIPDEAAVKAEIDVPQPRPCRDGSAFLAVSVECIQGSCNMPNQMWTGSNLHPICSGDAYGLVLPTGASASATDTMNTVGCDVAMSDGNSTLDEGTSLLYISRSGDPKCHGFQDTQHQSVKGGNMKAMAMFT